MSWKKILKEQRTLGDFGMNRGTRQATFPQMERDAAANQQQMERDAAATLQSRKENMKQRIPEIKAKLESMRGRATTTEQKDAQGRPITQDAADYLLRNLQPIESGNRLDDFEAFDNKDLKSFLGEK